MTKPGTEADKGEKWSRSAIAEWLAAAKANIMYIEVNLYAEDTTYHTQITHSECFLILITFDEKAQKPPHIWGVSIDGQHSKVVQKPKVMRYAFLPKRTGLGKTSPTIAHSRHEIAEPRLPQPRHNVSMGSQCGRDKPPFLLRPRPQKAASRTAKRANAQGGLKLNDGLPERVGLGEWVTCLVPAFPSMN